MAIQESSTFDCPDCDTKAPSTAVPYDTLGYVVCPVCEYTSGPSAEREEAE